MVGAAAIALAGCGGSSARSPQNRAYAAARTVPATSLVYTVFRGTGERFHGELWNRRGLTARAKLLAKPRPIVWSNADSAPAWSPDGRRIAFSGSGPDRKRGVYYPGIYLTDADGSNTRRLTSGRDDLPSWSRDGSRIVFQRGSARTHAAKLFVISVDGGSPKQLTHPHSSWPNHALLDGRSAWAPDGRRIVFERWHCNSKRCLGSLWQMRPDGTHERPYIADAAAPAFAADGTLAYGGGHLTNAGIWIRRPGAAPQLLVRNPTAIEPSWSPDGTRLAYVAAPTGARYAPLNEFEVYVFDFATWSSRRLTRDRLGQGEPAWQPLPGTVG